MKKVNNIPPANAKENYERFEEMVNGLKSKDYNIILFYGNPTHTEKSWCPDCISSHDDFMNFAEEYDGKARLSTVPVGRKVEFGRYNPFKVKFPHLITIPTLMFLQIIKQNSDVYKKPLVSITEPTIEDIRYFVKKYDL